MPHEAIEAAFVASIRSVLLIDDEFPRYDALIASPEKPLPADADRVRAGALWSFCRRRNFACDVEDGSEIDLTNSIPAHIGNSDLIVLDFHLAPNDSAKSLHILNHLAQSHHVNLVVVYT